MCALPNSAWALAFRAAYFLSKGWDILIIILGPLLVCFALGLITTISWICLALVIPLVAEPLSISWAIIVSIGIFILFNTLYNYLSVVIISPGVLEDLDEPFRDPVFNVPINSSATEPLERTEDDEALPFVSDNPSDRSNLTQRRDNASVSSGSKPPQQQIHGQRFAPNVIYITYSYCNKCEKHRPDRAHHCSVCKRCVLKMDHHCPWVNNCIGEGNYKFFFNFLAYVEGGCIYTNMMCFFPFFFGTEKPGVELAGVYFQAHSLLALGYILSLSIGLGVGCLLGFHIYLILTNQTSIEFQANRSRAKAYAKNGMTYRNPHDKGAHRNWQEVFGPCRYKVVSLLPSFERPRVGPLVSRPEYSSRDAAHIV